MPKRFRARRVGTLGKAINPRKLTKTLETFKVVGIKDEGGLIEYGQFIDFVQAKVIADSHTDEVQMCVVYGLDSRVVYSTER